MNKRFTDYLSLLTPRKRDLVQEAVREYLAGESEDKQDISTAVRVYNQCRDMSLFDVEHFDILMLNQRYKLIKRENISIGGITETAVDVRIIFRECLLNNATILMCVHNHPSGNVYPSRSDDELTRAIHNAAKLMRIHFADHVIIGDGDYFSYREEGKL